MFCGYIANKIRKVQSQIIDDLECEFGLWLLIWGRGQWYNFGLDEA